MCYRPLLPLLRTQTPLPIQGICRNWNRRLVCPPSPSSWRHCRCYLLGSLLQLQPLPKGLECEVGSLPLDRNGRLDLWCCCLGSSTCVSPQVRDFELISYLDAKMGPSCSSWTVTPLWPLTTSMVLCSSYARWIHAARKINVHS